MTDVGDLRQRIQWGEISGQIQSLGVLYDKIADAARMKNTKLNANDFENVASLKLLTDCLCSTDYLVVQYSLKLCERLLSFGVIEHTLLCNVLKNILSYSSHHQVLVDQLCNFMLKYDSNMRYSHTFILFCSSNPKYMDNIIDWLLNAVLHTEHDNKMIEKLEICLLLNPAVPLLKKVRIFDSMDVHNEHLLEQLKPALIQLIRFSGENDVQMVVDKLMAKGFISKLDQDVFHRCFNQSKIPHNFAHMLPTNFKLTVDSTLDLCALVILSSIYDQKKLIMFVVNSLSCDVPTFCHALLLPAILHVYGNLSSIKCLGIQSEELAKSLTLCIQKINEGLVEKEHFSGDVENSLESLVYSLKQKHERAFVAWMQTSLKYSWNCQMEPIEKFRTVSYFLGIMAISNSTDQLQTSLSVICKIVEHDPTLSSLVFPVIMHRFSKEKDIVRKNILLHTLPNLATHRFCIPPILKFLLAMVRNPKIATEMYAVIGELWLKQDRIYTQIKDLLMIDTNRDTQDIQMSKIAIIRMICERNYPDCDEFESVLLCLIVKEKAESHQNLVAECVLAVTDMCRNQVLQYETIWKQMWPALRGDQRPPVLFALCKFMALSEDITDINQALKDEIVGHVWSFAVSSDPQVSDAALIALTAFNPVEFSLKMLPAIAKENLKVPKQMIRTPADAAKNPEDVLTFIPPYCYVDLAKKLCNSLGEHSGLKTFLAHLLKHEVENLGRAAYHPAPSKIKTCKPVKSAQDMSTFCGMIGEMYVSNANQSTNASFAVGVLQYYEPTMEYGKTGEVTRRSIFAHGRKYLDMLKKLLNDIPVDVSDWFRSLVIIRSWPQFINKTFHALLHSRLEELNLAPSKSEEHTRRIDNAWFWARDQVIEVLKQGSRNSSISHANSLIALASLALAVKEYLVNNESSIVPNQQTDCTNWIVAVVETLLSHCTPAVKIKGQPIITLLAKPNSQVRCLASVGAALLLPEVKSFYQEFIGEVELLFAKDLVTSLTSTDVFVSFYLPLSLGIFVEKCWEKNESLCSKYVMELMSATKQNVTVGKTWACASLGSCNKLPNSGPFTSLGLLETLLVAYQSCSTNQLLSEAVLASCIQCCKNLVENGTLNLNNRLIKDLEKIILANQDQKKHVVAFDVMVKKDGKHILVEEAIEKLERLEGLPMRLADSVDILCTAALVRQEKSAKDVQKWVQVLSTFGTRILQEQSENVFLLNTLCLKLPELHVALLKSSEDTDGDGLPSDYSYLSDRLLLRQIVSMISNHDDTDNMMNGLYFDLLEQLTKLLPPLNWERLITPYLGENEMLNRVVPIACYQQNGSLIKLIIRPSVIPILNLKNIDVVVDTLPTWVLKIEPSAWSLFLNHAASRCTSKILVDAVVKLTKDENLPASHKNVVYDVICGWANELKLEKYSDISERSCIQLVDMVKCSQWNHDSKLQLMTAVQSKPLVRSVIRFCLCSGFEGMCLKSLVEDVQESCNRPTSYLILLHLHTMLYSSTPIAQKFVLEIMNLSSVSNQEIDIQTIFLTIMCLLMNSTVAIGFPLPVLEEYESVDHSLDKVLLHILYSRTSRAVKHIVKQSVWGEAMEKVLLWFIKLSKLFDGTNFEFLLFECISSMKNLPKFLQIIESQNLSQIICDKILLNFE